MTETATPTRCYCSDLQGVLCGTCRAGNETSHPSRSGAFVVYRIYTGVPGGSAYKVWAVPVGGSGAEHRQTFEIPDPAFEDVAGWRPEARERAKTEAADASTAYANHLWETL